MWRLRFQVLALAGILPLSCPASSGDPASVAATDAGAAVRLDIRFLGPEDRDLSSCHDVVEGPQGKVYMANEQLLRFDGVRWEVIETPGLFDPVSLAFDGGDRLWVGGIGEIGYIEADAAGVPRFTLMTYKVGEHAFEEVWQIFVDGSEVVFVTKDSVLRWNGQAFRIWTFENTQRLLGFSFEGGIYVHARGDGLFRLEGEEWTRVAGDGLPEGTGTGIIGMHRRRNGGILCLSTLHLHTLEDGVFERLPTGFDAWLEADYPVAASLLGNGVIALGTIKGGLLFTDGDGAFLGRITQVRGRPVSAVIALGPSSSGGLWAGFRGGLLHLRPAAFSRFDFPGGAEQSYVHDMTLHEGHIYAATSRGLFRASGEAPATGRFDLVDPRHAWSVTSRGTDLLCGTLGAVTVYRKGEVAQTIDTVRADTNFTFPSRFSEALVHVGTPERYYPLRFEEGSWISGEAAHFRGSPSSAVEVSADRLYLGTFKNGLFLATGEGRADSGWTLASSGNPQLDEGFVQVHRSGRQLLAIADEGLFRATVDDPVFRHDPLLGDAIGENVYMVDMAGDFGTGGIYVSLQENDPLSRQPTRIGRITIDGREQLHWEELYLPGIGQAGVVRELFFEDGPDGRRLWVGGNACILRYDMDRYEPAAAPRASLGRVLTVAGNDTLWGGFGASWPDFEWDFSRRSLHFDFAAAENLERDLRFQSRLVGFEEDWTAPSDSGFREITNLRERRYTLEVRAVDGFGRPGPVAAYDFSLRPPWFRTAGAYAGYLILAAVTVGGLVRWRTCRLRRQARELEMLVNARTEELEQRNLELIEANSVKDDFLANMSHEIRNPLNGILGITRMLRERKAEFGEDARSVDYLDSCSSHLNQLLTEVLDYASLESGKLEPKHRRFNVRRIVDDVLLMHEEMAREKGLELRSEFAEVPCLWVGDPVFLKQILINLVSNAIKYTNEGGVVFRFSYTTSEASVEARFEVEDTGPGIPREQQAAVFEKFTRLSKAAESTVSGTGLGLAIASEMAALIHGRIDLESEPGRGSRFILNVPFDTVDEAVEKPSAEAEAPECLHGIRVLVADDLDFNRFINSELLTRLGAEVTVAEDGVGALDALRGGTFDLVLLDINMPELTGIEVVSEWGKEHPEGARPLFIALSAYVADEMIQRCLGAGFDHFLEKPLEQSSLLSVLPESFFKEGSRKTQAPTSSLLDYLSDQDEESKNRILERYRETLAVQALDINRALTSEDVGKLREVLHKFRGVANIRRDEAVFRHLNRIGEYAGNGDWAAALSEARELQDHVAL